MLTLWNMQRMRICPSLGVLHSPPAAAARHLRARPSPPHRISGPAPPHTPPPPHLEYKQAGKRTEIITVLFTMQCHVSHSTSQCAVQSPSCFNEPHVLALDLLQLLCGMAHSQSQVATRNRCHLPLLGSGRTLVTLVFVTKREPLCSANSITCPS